MPRSMVGLLAAAGTAMSALVGLAHGDIVWVVIADAAVATGLIAYITAPFKKDTICAHGVIHPPDAVLARRQVRVVRALPSAAAHALACTSQVMPGFFHQIKGTNS